MGGYQVAAYYFPNYHVDPRNEAWHGAGWTEWELVKRAEPRFPGHQQPKTPAWGYLNEARPEVAERQIAAAADHGLTAWLYDWYWYEDGPYLNRALEEGFLKARNNDRLKFAIHWANHDWINIHPYKRGMTPTVLARGAVTAAAFEAATNHCITRYFGHPSYWTIQGRPYFSFYELMRLIEGLGGVPNTRAALDGFRRRTMAAGYPNPHLNAVVWNIGILPGERTLRDPNELLDALGFDSVTSYVWIHHTPLDSFPSVPYADYARAAQADWPAFSARYTLPYYPNVTMGWDSSPRTVQSDIYENLGYPFMATLADNTPSAFRAALLAARDFLDRGLTTPPILTVNAWNEWTEGSYLEPDTLHGMAYLEAIRDVFGMAAAQK